MTWPADQNADDEALFHLRGLLLHQQKAAEEFLLVTLSDLALDDSLDEDSPRLETFRFVLGASSNAVAQSALRNLEVALAEICIDEREPQFEHLDPGQGAPDLERILHFTEGVSWVHLGIPQIHRVPGDERIYPEIFHTLESSVLDALLKCFAAFLASTTSSAPTHHRALGRRSYIDAALSVDKELARISASFDFLLSISPINTQQAYEHFCAGRFQSDPVFRYRPLTVSPDLVKRALYALDIRTVEDPVLENLFREKQREIDRQLIMIQSRNTDAFKHAAVLQYGGVETSLLEEALGLLASIDEVEIRPSDCIIDCHAVKFAAENLVAMYQQAVPEFCAHVELRDDIAPGLMVSRQTLMISTATSMPRYRLDALLQHEISVHLLTWVNGSQQGLGIFGTGLAGYEGIQEGLGVFAEFVVDGLTRARLRLLAARVLIVDAMLRGASFVDCHRLLHDDHGFSSQGAFNIVARVFRSGGLSKDAVYLRGFKRVCELIHEGSNLESFWIGKISDQHLPVVAELQARGMLRAPLARPEFLNRSATRMRVEHIRLCSSFADLIRSSVPC